MTERSCSAATPSSSSCSTASTRRSRRPCTRARRTRRRDRLGRPLQEHLQSSEIRRHPLGRHPEASRHRARAARLRHAPCRISPSRLHRRPSPRISMTGFVTGLTLRRKQVAERSVQPCMRRMTRILPAFLAPALLFASDGKQTCPMPTVALLSPRAQQQAAYHQASTTAELVTGRSTAPCRRAAATVRSRSSTSSTPISSMR